MKMALFHCCHPRVFLNQGESLTLLLRRMGIACVEIKAFQCCGYPVKNIDYRAYITASARNLALAARHGLDMVTYCSCCYGSLRQAMHVLGNHPDLLRDVNRTLRTEGLQYEGGPAVKHYLEVCYHDIGPAMLSQMVKRPLQGMKTAAQHGCHLLRPRRTARFDHPTQPRIFDRLIALTGAQSVAWPDRLVCCSAPMFGVRDDLAAGLLRRKIDNARQSGAECVCTACANCQLQFDRAQNLLTAETGAAAAMPAISYVQLLGLSMGIAPADLYMDKHAIPTDGILAGR